MNARGHPESLISSHPGNTNAVKAGVYSPRLRARRADEIATRLAKQPLLEVAGRAVVDEVAALRELEGALLDAIERFGVSTRAGAARGPLDQLSRVSQQLGKLARETWLQEFDDWTLTTKTVQVDTTRELPDGDSGSVGEDHPQLVSLRERLVRLLALRDGLDEDLRRNGAVSRRGGERRHVGQRLRVSRDLVGMKAEVRRVVAASSPSEAGATGAWALAHELGFRSDTPTASRLRALAFLLDNPSPPPELSEFEREIQTWPLERVNAELARLSAGGDDGQAEGETPASLARPERVATERDPNDARETIRARYLGILQLIVRGADPHASSGHRLQAAALHDRYAPCSSGASWLDVELQGMSDEDIDLDLEQLLADDSDE